MREYGGATPRQRKAFQRELEDVASAVTRIAPRLPPKVVKLLDGSLVHARRTHFGEARKVLRKLDKPLGLYREMKGSLEEYRRLYRGLQQEAQDLQREAEVLAAVPKPPVGPGEVAGVMSLLQAYNEEVRRAYGALLEGPPARALSLLLEASSDPRTGVPHPGDREEALRFVEYLDRGGTISALPGRGLGALLQASQASEARLAHLLPDPKGFRRFLQAQLPWVKALMEAQGKAFALSWNQPADTLEGRLDAIADHLSRMPGAEGALHRLQEIGALATSGTLWAAQAAEGIYRNHGNAARWSWEGTLETRVSSFRSKAEAIQALLAALPAPDDLSGPG
jgi:hypothetical protein